jgi:hypothetical protein
MADKRRCLDKESGREPLNKAFERVAARHKVKQEWGGKEGRRKERRGNHETAITFSGKR